jgi:anti-sigma B factor antagonist
MTIHEHADAALHVLTLEGEVDLHHSNELRAVLTKSAEAKCPALLVDLSGVTYMDSSGLATLVEYMQRANKYGGQFALGGVSERLRTIFDLARLGEIFAIHESVDAAKAALRK